MAGWILYEPNSGLARALQRLSKGASKSKTSRRPTQAPRKRTEPPQSRTESLRKRGGSLNASALSKGSESPATLRRRPFGAPRPVRILESQNGPSRRGTRRLLRRLRPGRRLQRTNSYTASNLVPRLWKRRRRSRRAFAGSRTKTHNRLR